MLVKHIFGFVLYFVLISVFVNVLNAQHFGQGEGLSCNTNSGKPGICKLFDNCRDIDALYADGEPHICGWTNGDAIVCCPQASSLPKSEQKCEEYSKIRCSEEDVGTVQTIVGGEEVNSVLEYPHQVHIGYGKYENPTYSCGGTLISEQWVMTAAHCLTSRAGGKLSAVALGFLDSSNPTEFGTYQKRRVVQAVKHPERGNTKYHDIALLKLDQPVSMSKSAVPACLHNTARIPTSQAIATGWGNTAYGNRAQSDKLMKVILRIVNHTACYSAYEKQKERKFSAGVIEESQFCAGQPMKDTCQGDSGGPLQILHSNLCMHRIIGITSFGSNCGVKEGVYTRVSHYLPWIESIVWP